MPSRSTTRAAKQDLRQGYAPTTAAGEFVGEEMHHRKQGKHGAESRRQAIAIGLSKARRAGIPIRKRPAKRVSTKRGKVAGTRKRSGTGRTARTASRASRSRTSRATRSRT